MDRPKDRPRLGRGLASLMSVSRPSGAADDRHAGPPATDTPVTPGTPATDAAGTAVTADSAIRGVTAMEIGVSQIQPNPHQPRRSFNEVALCELADSMKTAGLIQPVIVRRVADGFELIAGERRLRAAKLAGLQTVPALVREDVDAVTQAQMALIENIQREDLNPVDRAEAYKTLMNQLGLSQAELAMRLGEDRGTIAHYVRLLDLCPPVRQLVRDGRLPVGHAKVLAGVVKPAEQERLANLAITQDLTVRNLERLIAKPVAESQPKPAEPTSPSAHIQDLERTLQRELGMRVQLRTVGSSKSKGRLVIHYANLDQFDQLLSKLGIRLEE